MVNDNTPIKIISKGHESFTNKFLLLDTTTYRYASYPLLYIYIIIIISMGEMIF